ncbi:MAG: hypothetical protein K2P52_02540 [Campylobacterales bacterium]|nr:hypothetical protein [Campylobacterales bacterium]
MPETEKINEILARLDERSKAINDSMKSLQENIISFKHDLKTQNDTLVKKIEKSEDDFNARLEKLESKIELNYVKQEKFNPIERIVYGIIGLILVAVCTGLLSYVIVGKQPVGVGIGSIIK